MFSEQAEKALLESGEMYRMLVDNIHDGVFIIQDAKIQFANRAFGAMVGYAVEEVVGKHFQELVAPEDLKMVSERYHRRQAGDDVPQEYEFAMLHRDGKTRILVDMKVGLIMYRGRVASMGTVMDITERKRVEKELQERERFMANIFSSIQDGIGILDMDMNIIHVNPTIEKWYQHAVPLAGRKCYEALHSRSGRCEVCPARRTIETCESAYGVVPKHGPGGKEIGWLEIYSFPLVDEATGQMKGVIEYVRDITERRKAEEAIRKYASELNESNRMKDLFTDIMHHDLLNPLNAANGFAELLKQNETEPEKINYLEIIIRCLSRSMELIDSATKFSKIECLESIEFEDMDLAQTVKDVIENFRDIAARAGTRLENNINCSMPVRANRIIEEVVANLISNALKYAPESKIIVEGGENGSFWRIKVIDSGEGIKDEDKMAIFERFRRMEKRGVKGSGLGLAIARKVVELHNGRIWVEDNPAGGAVFIVEIPGHLQQSH